VGDLVLRLRQDARGRHKLTPPWEGPFIIAKILKPGTYKLANDRGKVYNNAWNIQHNKTKATRVHPIWGLRRWKGAMHEGSAEACPLPGGSIPF
jgi:hypothetical protein